ncbi:hypothetical protein K474DRAFT_1608247 [Panus rudis PR-1116 ss-1]|nr:hypothetical protein K474DRAFT_1608247 [Panus rudis PR-1116 ss-1]
MSQKKHNSRINLEEPVAGPSNHGIREAGVVPDVNTHQEKDASVAPEDFHNADDEVPNDLYLAQVIEIIPDVDPDFALALLNENYPNFKEQVVEHVLHALFENPSYPKVEKGKGKRKREASDEGERAGIKSQREEAQVDYLSKNRRVGPNYHDLALHRLYTEFPQIPVAHIRRKFQLEGGLYAPTYFYLHAERKSGKLPYKPLTTAQAKNRNKGKEAIRADPDFEEEVLWVQRKLMEEAVSKDSAIADEVNQQEHEAAGAGIECGCCFSDYPFDNMIQCPDAHLFCKSCMSTYAETLLGSHDPKIVCMDQSGCKLPFPESELRRFLTPKLLSLYERVKQQKEIEAAGLENLEECPFCDYKVVIENEHEKLFHCQNEDCGAVSCRQCKKLDHLPKSCKEVEEDKKLDARHAVEEAMTQALMRNCPKCKKPFIKEAGCNKMICPNCRTMSCYICRKVIQGYEHFNQRPPYDQARDDTKCPLWDQAEQRHAAEVAEAARKAKEALKAQQPDIDEKDLEVELPKAPPAPQAPIPAIPHHHLPQAARQVVRPPVRAPAPNVNIQVNYRHGNAAPQFVNMAANVGGMNVHVFAPGAQVRIAGGVPMHQQPVQFGGGAFGVAPQMHNPFGMGMAAGGPMPLQGQLGVVQPQAAVGVNVNRQVAPGVNINWNAAHQIVRPPAPAPQPAQARVGARVGLRTRSQARKR